VIVVSLSLNPESRGRGRSQNFRGEGGARILGEREEPEEAREEPEY